MVESMTQTADGSGQFRAVSEKSPTRVYMHVLTRYTVQTVQTVQNGGGSSSRAPNAPGRPPRWWCEAPQQHELSNDARGRQPLSRVRLADALRADDGALAGRRTGREGVR